MTFLLIKTVHLFAAFVYGGFLITDNLFLSLMKKKLSPEDHATARGTFAPFVRAVVPKALVVAVITGLYLISQVFGDISEDGLSRFQLLLSIKAFLGIWLGVRGVLQVFFGIEPLLFKGHLLPFVFVLTIIFLSQFIYM